MKKIKKAFDLAACLGALAVSYLIYLTCQALSIKEREPLGKHA